MPTKSTLKKEVRVDRNIIQRLLGAINFGRQINLEAVFSHEITRLPSSLATTDGKLRATSKSSLMKILSGNFSVQSEIPESDH